MKRVAEATRPAARKLSVVVDVNVILDDIFDRLPWADDATRLLDVIAGGTMRGFVAGTTVTTVHYLVERALGRARASTAISDILEILEVVPLDSADFQRALGLGLKEFEDAVQVAASLHAGVDVLVTRNERDFRDSPVTVRSAGEVLAMVAAAGT